MQKWNIGWGTVSKCNMNCQFCYSKHKRTNSKDLGLKDWISFIDNNYARINSINYGTGENSLSEDWFAFVEYVRKNYPHIRQALTTNGYISVAVNEDEIKKKIILNSIDEMDISLDYCDSVNHSLFRGQPKAFEWALNTLMFCEEHDIRSTIVSIATAKNFTKDNMAGIFDIAKTYGALVRVNLYRPTRGIDELAKEFILPPETLLEMIKWISEQYSVLSISDVLLSTLLTDASEYDPSGIDSLRILPDGGVAPSTYLIDEEYIVGNIRDSDILKKIEDEGLFNDLIYTCIPEECRECSLVKKCKGGVFDRRYLWYNTLNRKDPYCIYTPGKDFPSKIVLSNEIFESIHHGYLPTMFFKP